MIIKVNQEDLRLTILGCFRYSLGRMTYMPSHTVMMFINYKEIFREHDWESVIKEIDEELFRKGVDESHRGRDCDDVKWQELKDFAVSQINGKQHSEEKQ